jgi:hypothetical protein
MGCQVKETDWLGHWLTPQCLKPWKKKIDTILHMDHPCNNTELRMFIGCLNYYHDMWPNHAHILNPLTDQSGLKKRALIKWTDDMQQAFDKMRLLTAADTLAAYPNHNKRFDVYTDASDFQLGACIIQEGRPVAYFLQKLTKYQQIIQQWKRKCFPSLQLSKNFEVCSSVQTFIFLWTIKT